MLADEPINEPCNCHKISGSDKGCLLMVLIVCVTWAGCEVAHHAIERNFQAKVLMQDED